MQTRWTMMNTWNMTSCITVFNCCVTMVTINRIMNCCYSVTNRSGHQRSSHQCNLVCWCGSHMLKLLAHTVQCASKQTVYCMLNKDTHTHRYEYTDGARTGWTCAASALPQKNIILDAGHIRRTGVHFKSHIFQMIQCACVWVSECARVFANAE